MLAQVEGAAQRLKASHGPTAPCCVEANATALAQLQELIAFYAAQPRPEEAGEGEKGGAGAGQWQSYILLALLRLLTLNLRQVQQPVGSALGQELVRKLRSVLLGLVSGGARESDAGAGGRSVGSVQEEAVAALRAGTPVLFSDPSEIVGLLDVMLRKQSEQRASETEEQFMVMLLSYVAKVSHLSLRCRCSRARICRH
eukprot:3834675-Rhodomonas_salina.1